MAATLGANVTLCCSLGGEPGQVLEVLLRKEGIRLASSLSGDPSPAYVHDRRAGDRDPLAATPGPRLSRHEADELYNIAIAEGISNDVVVLTGQNQFATIPPAMYGRLSRDLHANGVRIVADLTGEELAALDRVDILKVAHADLLEDGDAASDNIREFIVVLEDLGARKAENVVVSRAERPALAFFDGRLLEVQPPSFEAIDHHGAGDSMTAALAVALATGRDAEATLQLAAAAGALNVTRRGLGSGHRQSIEKVAHAVRVRPLDRNATESEPSPTSAERDLQPGSR
jgi:1-phosphofructokinase